MDSVAYPETNYNSCDPRFIDLDTQNEAFQRNVFDWIKEQNGRSHVQKRDLSVYERPPSQSSSSKGEMSFGEIPVVDNTFSLPQNVFERVLASQQRALQSSQPSTRFTETARPAPYLITAGQCRRPSSDYVTELTGNEAKRPRLSPTEQNFPQQMHHQKTQQEQLKLQMIMNRFDNTRGKVMRLLKLQKARERLHQYQNPASRSADFNKDQPRYVLVKRTVRVPDNLLYKYNASVVRPQSQGLRRVPGIHVERTGSYYNSSDSAGLAVDHQTLPKIIAVHSVMKNAPVSAESCISIGSRPPLRASAAREEHTIRSGVPSSVEFRRRSPSHQYLCEKSTVRQNESRLLISNEITSGVGNFQNCENDEVSLTKVIPGKASSSVSPLTHGTRNQDEIELANCNENVVSNEQFPHPVIFHHPGQVDHSKNVTYLEHARLPAHIEHSVRSDHLGHVDHWRQIENMGRADHTGPVPHPAHVDQPGTVDLTGHVDHTEHADHTGSHEHAGHVEHPTHVDQTGPVEHTGHDEHPAGHVNHWGHDDSRPEINLRNDDEFSPNFSETKQVESQNQHSVHADSELYLGGPPPCLPVLNRSEMIEREKKTDQPRCDSNPTSPRLTKTVPEISEKIIETRERMKTETINWKKCVLVKLERRLIRKLRRAEILTGEKTEIKDLRQEVPEPVTKRKKSGGGQGGRTVRQDSGSESATSDNEDIAAERQEQEGGRSSRDSVAESVTVGDDDVAAERHGQEAKSGCRHSVTESVTVGGGDDDDDDDDDAVESHGQKAKSNCRKNETESVTGNDEHDAVERQGQEERSSWQNSVTDSDTDESPLRLEQRENVVTSGNKQMESPQDEREEEKCEESQNAESPSGQKGNVNTGDIGLTTNTHKVDFVALEQSHSQECVADKTVRKSETLDAESVEFQGGKEKAELTKVSPEKPSQNMQRDRDRKECVSPRSSASEKQDAAVHATKARTDLFETILSRVEASDCVKNDKLMLEATIEDSSLAITQDNSIPVEKTNCNESLVTLPKNMASLKQGLQSCGKQTLEIKQKTVDCERNIWATLRKDGIF